MKGGQRLREERKKDEDGEREVKRERERGEHRVRTGACSLQAGHCEDLL